MMKWEKLINSDIQTFQRGMLLKFQANHPFEGQVIMMVCEGWANSSEKALITISGHKSGINPYVAFPSDEVINGSLRKDWLIKNWNKWVWPEGNINDVWVRGPLDASEL